MQSAESGAVFVSSGAAVSEGIVKSEEAIKSSKSGGVQGQQCSWWTVAWSLGSSAVYVEW